MLTIIFDFKENRPLYEQLYQQIRKEIENGEFKVGEKLPSIRKLSAHLQVSRVTVESAYAQLLAEGYLEAVEKKGYFVRPVKSRPKKAAQAPAENQEEEEEAPALVYDLKTNAVNMEDFPFATWARLMRECLREEGQTLLAPVHPQGDEGLREEIAQYLEDFRNMRVSPDQIVLGAGTEYLLGLVTELLPQAVFALENPGYHKIARILASRRLKMEAIPLDAEGMSIEALQNSPATVAHVTPSHHFPLGTVMSVNRRMQMLQWAEEEENRYLIEDDYDSEFRFVLKPIPTLYSLEEGGENIIYMNTFTKTLTPSLRIGYMVLPPKLLELYRKNLTFYSCTVSQFEQRTLRAFLKGGYYERHLNRMRNIYRSRRDAFLGGLAPLIRTGKVQVEGADAGLHLLLRFHNGLTEKRILSRAQNQMIGVYPLSQYYLGPAEETRSVVLGYAGYPEADLKEIARCLVTSWY